MRPAKALVAVLSFSSLGTAWPWPPSLQDFKALHGLEGLLLPRQNNGNGHQQNSKAALGPPTPTATQAQATSQPTSDSNQSKGSAQPSGSSNQQASGTGSNQGSGAASKGGNKQTSTSKLPMISDVDPPGGCSMLTPAATLGEQYYRVGTTATWVWNYTSLLRTPSAVDVLATVSASGVAASAFTIATNLSFEATQTLKWDTGAFASDTLLPVGTYTLIVYDADNTGGVTAIPKPGYLGTWEQFYFGMYTPSPYVGLQNPYVCATCNAAGGKMERLTWTMLASVVGVTISSFIWFAGLNGIFF